MDSSCGVKIRLGIQAEKEIADPPFGVQYWPIPPDNEITIQKIPHFRVQFKNRMKNPNATFPMNPYVGQRCRP